MHNSPSKPDADDSKSGAGNSPKPRRKLFGLLGRTIGESESPRAVSVAVDRPSEELSECAAAPPEEAATSCESLISCASRPGAESSKAEAHGASRSVGGSRRLLIEVADLSIPLALRPTSGGFETRASTLTYNAICMEVRDMFRIIEGLVRTAAKNTLEIEDIYSFYEWFEGFHAIATTIFDVQEDVLFSWLEKIGAIEMENALAPKRRKTKQERTKDACWDILELKIQFQKQSDRKFSMEDLVLEMSDEVHHLASRILAYIATVEEELPPLISKHFDKDESAIIEGAVYSNLKSSDQGSFVLAAYARGIMDPHEREQFLVSAFLGGKKKKATEIRQPGVKHCRRFQSNHVDIAEKLAGVPDATPHLVSRNDEH
jgi:hypothetical protein